jgi:hypothetical protein
VYTQPLSVSTAAGGPHRLTAWRNTFSTRVAVATGSTRLAVTSREWSSRKLQISTSLPPESFQAVTSDCQHSLGSLASNRIHELRGRL